jgi:putative ABC transport system permease protein
MTAPLIDIRAWLRFAAQNTLRNRRRSAVTLAIAALGTAAILLAGGFALFTYEALAQAAARGSGHLVVATAGQFAGDEDQPLQHGLDDSAGLQARLLADPAVRQVLPQVEFGGLVSNGDKSVIMVGVGIAPDAEFAIKGPFLTVKAGQVITDADRGRVMLGEGLARHLKAAPGSMLTLLASTTTGALNAIDVTVQGIVATGIPEMDQRLVYTDVATAQSLLATTRISRLGVFLDRMESTEPARERLAPLLPGLRVRTWLDEATFYLSVRALYDRIFGALGLIIATIVVFVVANSMAMAVIERTREVGTLRALGTLPGQLTRSFALEGLVLGASGALLGAAFAGAVSLALLLFPVQMPPPPGRSTGYPLQITLDAGLMAIAVLAIVVLCTLAAAMVARRTVRMPIVEALAHT